MVGVFLIGADPLFEKVDRPPILLVEWPLAEATLGFNDLLGKADGLLLPFAVSTFPEVPRGLDGLFEKLERLAFPEVLGTLAESPR